MKLNALLLLVFIPVVLAGETIPVKIAHDILIAQDLRDADALGHFLSDKNTLVRARAAFACGSVQDTTNIRQLLVMLSDKQSAVRGAAAFALGQYSFVVDSARRTRISRNLAKRLGYEENQEALLRVIEALGKAGDEYSLSVLVAAGETSPSDVVKSEVALSVGRYAYRGIKSKIAASYCAGLLSPSFRGEHWKAAYALMRIADPDLFSRCEEQIMRAASHPDPRVRMFVATALGKIVSIPKAVNALLSLTISDRDWRVRVNAIKSLGKIGSALHARVLPVLFQTAADSNEHVSLTVLSTLGDMKLASSAFSAECRDCLVGVITDSVRFTQRQKKEAAVTLGKTFGAEAFPILEARFRSEHLTKESFIAALAYTPTRDALQGLLTFDQEGDPRIQRETLESLLSCTKLANKDSAMTESAAIAFVTALESKDMAVIATAAGALADPLYADERSVAPLLSSLLRLKSPGDTEAMVAIIQALAGLKAKSAIGPLESQLNDPDHIVAMETAIALEKITGRQYMRLVKENATPSYKNFDWNLLDWIHKNPRVDVRTSKGTFSFALLPDEAPFTCINFATLIRNKFFDGRTFHRVVPNFVIQGGDPRGDGWGGPGYAIRSEFGFKHFEEGTVGVASSGKDTEGCQWFVTHCDTPHLDGRYTVFGKITDGMDVVNRIQVGDTIESMSLSN